MLQAKPDLTYLKHILDCCVSIEEYTQSMNEENFLRDKKTQDAVIRNFEVIGEATKHLSDAFRTSHSNIEWKKIAGLRDKLIHDYMGIDLWSIWVLATEMIPDFSTEIKKIISGEEIDR